MTTGDIKLAITIEPARLTMADREHIKIGFAATNEGSATVDPTLHLVRLSINGKDSPVFSLAIGNGVRDGTWFALPPGETTRLTWSTMGPSLFHAPGEYTLVLQHDRNTSEPVTVTVDP